MTPSRILRRLAPAAFAVCALVPFTAAAKAAESPMPTAQAVSYGMDWIPYIDPADLPPVAQRKVVCLVDSGVDITPDLPPDRPEGPIVERVSIDGGSGLGGPAWENQHGTRMALLAGAVPGNDYGTVGAWPAVRILSVRAMPYGERVFPGAHYDAGLRACNTASRAYPVVVANLSIACQCTLDADERARVVDAVATVHMPAKDMSVVAAAGNGGAGLLSPADSPGVLPIAAGDAAGRLCSYASFAPQALVGPGCEVDTAEASTPVRATTAGSSAAATHAAVMLAVLRTLRPDAHRVDAEAWMWSGAREVLGQRVLDGDGAARAAGLGPVVDRARARMTRPGGPAPAPSPASSPRRATPVVPTARRTMSRPQADVRWSAGRLRIRLMNSPKRGSTLLVGAVLPDRSRRRLRRTIVLRKPSILLRITKRPVQVSLRYGTSVDPRRLRSETTVLQLRSGGRYR